MSIKKMEVIEEVKVQQALGTAENRMTYREFVEQHLPKRDWHDKNVDLSIEDGWYDWFCKDESLPLRLKKMVPMIKRISKSKLFNIDTTYIFFKNNCPMTMPLYDDFRIYDIFTGDVLYTITSGQVWGASNDFGDALVKGSSKDIYLFFGV